MATPVQTIIAPSPISARIHNSCDFVQTLMKLQRAAQLITSTFDLEDLIERVTNDLALAIDNGNVSCWLRDSETNDMVLRGIHGRTHHSKGERLRIGCEGMVGHVAATGQMHYAPDVSLDPYYIACEPGTQSEISIPLYAGHFSVPIENARLFQRERQKREVMQREADEARAIQQSLFLKAVPLVTGFAFETAWHPAGAVAGDWFDFIDLGDQRYGIVLADVSGKGMSAALLMSATRAILRTIAPQHATPSETLEHL